MGLSSTQDCRPAIVKTYTQIAHLDSHHTASPANQDQSPFITLTYGY